MGLRGELEGIEIGNPTVSLGLCPFADAPGSWELSGSSQHCHAAFSFFFLLLWPRKQTIAREPQARQQELVPGQVT